jgi:hypothetical protein
MHARQDVPGLSPRGRMVRTIQSYETVGDDFHID